MVSETLVLRRIWCPAVVFGERLEASRSDSELVGARGVVEGGTIHGGDVRAVKGVAATLVACVALITNERIHWKRMKNEVREMKMTRSMRILETIRKANHTFSADVVCTKLNFCRTSYLRNNKWSMMRR